MSKQDAIIVGIQKANHEYDIWLKQAELLVKGTANHIVKSPVAHTDCEFGVWLYSDGQQLSSFFEFKDVELAHQAFHKAYESLYDGAKEVNDSESISLLKRHFSKLENQSALSIKHLEKIETSLVNEDDTSKNNENIASVASATTFEAESAMVEIEPSTPVQHPVSSSVDLLRQLKEQELLQLKQEQELTELELKQLEDRQRLTTQSTEQIELYQSLKEKEINQQLDVHKRLEESNINDIFLGQQDISRIKEEILSKYDELEQLALVDQKLEERKEGEKRKERRILNDFESRQALDKQDLIQLGHQREKWESEAEKLKQQLMLIEQDLKVLAEKESEKQALIDKSNGEKEVKLQELIQQSRLQDKLNGHKNRVKETKQAELKQLEEQQSSKREMLKSLELESVTLENSKIDIGESHKKELRELEERQRLKKSTIEKLDRNKSLKKQELKELIQEQSVIQQSLDQMNSSKIDNKKELEEV